MDKDMIKNDLNKTIDWYINESKKMENVSSSNTRAFSFDDDGVILVEYSIDRPNIEEITQELKKLKEEGVSTPLYLAYKKDYNNSVCYVLQEKAKGRIFSEITIEHNLEYAANIPVEHYAKFIIDVVKMNGLGIELRPRNFFYDENAGFTIIDIQGIVNGTYDKNSLKDIMFNFDHIYGGLQVNGDKDLSEEQEKKYKILNAKRIAKILLAFEQALPGFKENKRWILRELGEHTDFESLKEIGYEIPDLTLTEEEKAFFNRFIENEIDMQIAETMIGKDDYSQKHMVQVRNILESSIPYFPDYEFKNFNEQWDSLFWIKIRKAYAENQDNIYIENELIKSIMEKVDPVRLYDSDMLYNYVKTNLDNYLNDEYDDMSIKGTKKT